MSAHINQQNNRASLSHRKMDRLWKEFLRELTRLRKSLFEPYRPERRYMRGKAVKPF